MAFADDKQSERAALTDAMNRYSDGDGAAFVVLYDLLAPRLRGFLVRAVGNAALADDLAQQTFLQLHAARQSWMPGADVLPWAYAIARRLLIDTLRRSTREAARSDLPSPPGEATPDEVAAANELAARAQAELERLPALHRDAWQLVRGEGLTVAQAAAVLGATETAVRLRTFRASEALREKLGYGEESA